ncbi:hypothetical protein TNCV_2727601 [Trichonephila clavipes]|nr:hypothetical protein TNCV_2727601 [Trichonephila clavipes]
MVAERLACHHTPVTTIDELWHRLKLHGHLYVYIPSNLCLTQHSRVASPGYSVFVAGVEILLKEQNQRKRK